MKFPLAVGTILAFAVAGAGALPAAAQPAQLIAAQSEISFTSRQMGVPVEGRFGQFAAQVAFDPRQPAAGRIAFTVALNSVAMGVSLIEAEVAKPAWFDTAKFPQARFESQAIKPLGGGRFDVAGQLTLKGSTRDIALPVTLTQTGGETRASGSVSVKRLDFKIGEGEWADTALVANDVIVKFKLVLTGVGPL